MASYCKQGHDRDITGWDGKHCRVCRQERYRKVAKDIRLRKYNVTEEELDALLSRAVCDICSKHFTRPPHIDHDHKTGRVRGVLCQKCNMGLGLFSDNPELLERAKEYLIVTK